MIERVRVLGYRKFRELNFEPHQRLNILVADNDAGKSTLLEAITLALTGRVSGRLASDEVNPFWFNAETVKEFFAGRSTGETPAPPAIEIEVFLHDHDDFPDMEALDAQTDEAKIAAGCVRELKGIAETDWTQQWQAVCGV